MVEKWISYGFRVPLDEGEMEALQRAFSHYLDVRRRRVRKDGSGPAPGGSRVIKRILTQLMRSCYRLNVLSLGEIELPMLQVGLANYQDLCEREIASGATIPFVADLVIVKRIRTALEEEVIRTFSASLDGKFQQGPNR
jgi:hypothetical protein